MDISERTWFLKIMFLIFWVRAGTEAPHIAQRRTSFEQNIALVDYYNSDLLIFWTEDRGRSTTHGPVDHRFLNRTWPLRTEILIFWVEGRAEAPHTKWESGNSSRTCALEVTILSSFFELREGTEARDVTRGSWRFWTEGKWWFWERRSSRHQRRIYILILMRDWEQGTRYSPYSLYFESHRKTVKAPHMHSGLSNFERKEDLPAAIGRYTSHYLNVLKRTEKKTYA